MAVCAIESPIRWREIQKELFLQQQGEEGQWVLSKENKELKLSKAVEMISNPLQLDENQRRIMSALLKSCAILYSGKGGITYSVVYLLESA